MSPRQKILDYLKRHTRSLTSEISEGIGVSRRDVNTALFFQLRRKGLVERNETDHRWSLATSQATFVGDLFEDEENETAPPIELSKKLKITDELTESEGPPSNDASESVSHDSTPDSSGPNPDLPRSEQATPPASPEATDLDPKSSNAIKMLEFLEEWAKALNKPLLDVRGDSRIHLSFSEAESENLPGLTIANAATKHDAWLRLKRQTATEVPEPPESLLPWIQIRDDPKREPTLRESIPDPDADTAPSLADENDKEEDEEPAVLKLSEHPGIQQSFDSYLASIWKPWAEGEKPIRRSIAFYQKMFGLRQRVENPGSEAAIELLWGIGMSYWSQANFRTPLFFQPVEFAPASSDMAIEIHPLDRHPVLNIDGLFDLRSEGAALYEKDFREWLKTQIPPICPFAIQEIRSILEQGAARIDDRASFAERHTERGLPTNFVVTQEWCLICRQRSANYMLDDVARLKSCIVDEGLPEGAVAEIAVPRKAALPPLDRTFRGLSTPGVSSDGGQPVEDLFFPKPFNREQVQVVKNLERGYGVVLQGPPGTGKTHTIANIICHYLALGRRVLVTSKDAPALEVLRSQLPDDMQPLTAALLTQERKALREMEQGMSRITSEVMNLDRDEFSQQQKDFTRKIDELHAELARIECNLLQHAKHFLEPVPKHLGAGDPPTMARELVEAAPKNEWFPDELDPDRGWKKDDLAQQSFDALRNARKRLGESLALDPEILLDPERLPTPERVKTIHEHLIEDRKLDAQQENSKYISPKDIQSDRMLQIANDALKAIQECYEALVETSKDPWKVFIYRCFHLPKTLPPHLPVDQLLPQVKTLLEAGSKLRDQKTALLVYDIELPTEKDRHPDFIDRIAQAAKGQKAFSISDHITKRKLINQLSSIRLNGAPLQSPKEWQIVESYCSIIARSSDLKRKWNNLANKTPLPCLEKDGIDVVDEFAGILASIDRFKNFGSREFDQCVTRIRRAFRSFNLPELPKLLADPESALCAAGKTLEIAIDRFNHHEARQAKDLWITLLAENQDAPGVEDALSIITNDLGDPRCNRSKILSIWTAMTAKLNSFWSKKEDLELVVSLCDKINDAGAEKWSQRIRTIPVAEGARADPVVPVGSHETWLWAKQSAYLAHIDQKETLRLLNRKRLDAEKRLSRTYEQLAVNKTWLSLRNTLDRKPQIVGALQAFVQNIAQVGGGTGRLANHYRSLARKQMQKAHEAIRCWIMPEWRVCESIPPEVGIFDLVIIDEASQSDLRALPAIMRGKKILVVGDDKQVSPSQVGVSADIIEGLYHRFLYDLPLGDSMSLRNSIYDLASVAFAASLVRLREHFRCVEPIISFSSHQFYGGEIKCLRVPKASERLLPCLVCVRVLHGIRDGLRKVNRPEAEAIVDEIEALTTDPAFGDRSIGIVSLLGNEQPKLIYDILRDRIGEEPILKHRIAAGDAAAFQGSEFDVVFMSMVDSGTPRTLRSRVFEQRYNVASSRARDRLYLFHSLQRTDLNDSDLRARLLDHFKNPRTATIALGREACESPFEEAVFDYLTEHGFRVLTQVPAAGHRIDLVVEDSVGRRLAIECDGYVAHPPHRWLEDLARQRILERAGWTFHRIWGPSFYRDKAASFAELLDALDRHAIAKEDGDGATTAGVVEFREVAPPVLELEEESDEERELDEILGVTEGEDAEDAAERVEAATLHASARSDGLVPPQPEDQARMTEPEIAPSISRPIVKVGSTVVVEFVDEPGKHYRYTLTEGPSLPEQGLVNYEAPLGIAILDHPEGTEIVANLGGVERMVRILEVEGEQVAE